MDRPRHGTVAVWKDEEGYGFIRPDDGGADVFFHVTVLPRAQRRPRPDDGIRYRLGRRDGRRQAIEARLEGPALSPLLVIIAALFVATSALVALAVLGDVRLPWPLLVYLVMSVVAFVVYGIDKRRAGDGMWRVSETTLHALELAGGWPGALLGQRYFHHKTRKMTYQVAFWLIVAAHVGFWCWWFLVGL